MRGLDRRSLHRPPRNADDHVAVALALIASFRTPPRGLFTASCFFEGLPGFPAIQ
jgi:hypothetical protein